MYTIYYSDTTKENKKKQFVKDFVCVYAISRVYSSPILMKFSNIFSGDSPEIWDTETLAHGHGRRKFCHQQCWLEGSSKNFTNYSDNSSKIHLKNVFMPNANISIYRQQENTQTLFTTISISKKICQILGGRCKTVYYIQEMIWICYLRVVCFPGQSILIQLSCVVWWLLIISIRALRALECYFDVPMLIINYW